MPPRRTGMHKNQLSDLRASEFTHLKWNFTPQLATNIKYWQLETEEIKINDVVF